MNNGKGNIKNRGVAFTISEDLHQLWQSASENLIEQRIFRNKTEIFERLVLFLHSSVVENVVEKIETFRDSVKRN